MRIYSVINDALTVLYNELPQFYQDRDAAIWEAIQRLTQRYENLAAVNIDYNDAATKYAYLFKYAGSRACAVYSRHDIFALANLYAGTSLRHTSLGAGPGSDFLGVLKHFVQLGSQINLHVDLVDVDVTWRATAGVVAAAACNHLNGCPRPTGRFRQLDCSVANIAAELAPFQDSNLLTLSYLLSELPDGAARRLLEAIFGVARRGTVVLVIDNNTEPVRQLLTEAAQTVGLDVETCGAEVITLRNENVENMGLHYERFGDFNRNGFPHIVLDAFCFAATKR